MKLNRLIHEEVVNYINNIICESQESKSQSKAIKLAMQNGMDRDRAEQFIRVDLRNDLSELRHKDTAKFTLGCARLFFENQLNDAKSISLLNSILRLITNKYYDNFDQNLNGISMNDLFNEYSKELKSIERKNRADVNSKKYYNNGYKIVPINSFEEAQEYREYLYDDSPWCITYRDDMWDSYTRNNSNKVYFCLKDGFEHIAPPEETGNPKDEYGLSMISVIVDDEGNLAYSTTRWNHANKASGDHDFTVQEISDIVGTNFYETFKPNIEFKESINNAMIRLNNGEDINNIFDDIKNAGNNLIRVKLNGKYNFINSSKKLISKKWFDYANSFENNFSIVKLNDKRNLLNLNGELLSNQWFDYIDEFSDGFARVKVNYKYNFIRSNGKLLTDKWFYNAGHFKDGFAIIGSNKGYNFIDENGNILSSQWFDSVGNFVDGYAKIEINNKKNLININGNTISNQWFDDIGNLKNGFIRVKYGKKYNFIDIHGNLISNNWFDYTDNFNNGFAGIYNNNRYNFIDTNGNLLSDQWFDDIFNFKDGFAKVIINKKEYKIDTNGIIH